MAGIPLAVLVSGANRHDSIMFEPLLDALPALAGKRGGQDTSLTSYTQIRDITFAVAVII
jgi:hypothetical protein